MNGVIIQLVL